MQTGSGEGTRIRDPRLQLEIATALTCAIDIIVTWCTDSKFYRGFFDDLNVGLVRHEKNLTCWHKYFKSPFLKATNSDFVRLRRDRRGNKFSMVGTRCNEIRLYDAGQSQKSYPQIIHLRNF